MIFSVIIFLAMFGNAQPPTHTDRGQPTRTKGGARDKSENSVGNSDLSRRA